MVRVAEDNSSPIEIDYEPAEEGAPVAFPLVLGLDTFGDLIYDQDGRPLTHAQTIRSVLEPTVPMARRTLLGLRTASSVPRKPCRRSPPAWSKHACRRLIATSQPYPRQASPPGILVLA